MVVNTPRRLSALLAPLPARAVARPGPGAGYGWKHLSGVLACCTAWQQSRQTVMMRPIPAGRCHVSRGQARARGHDGVVSTAYGPVSAPA